MSERQRPIRLPRPPDQMSDAELWALLEADPDFHARQAQALADFAAGRWYRLDPETSDTHPNPDWPKDGPQPAHD